MQFPYQSSNTSAGLLPRPPNRQNSSQWTPRSNNSSGGNSKPQCQICGKRDLTALISYHRTNLSYQPSQQPRNFNTVALTIDSSFPNSAPPIALMATPNTVGDPAWYLDFGATYHFTLDLSMMHEAMAYLGIDQVMVGNVKTLPISHIGHSTLSTPHSPLQLRNILHTPQLYTNLLSVSKLCFDNNAYVEFHPHSYLVKDQVTNQVLLQARLENGLYGVPFSPRSPAPTNLSPVYFLNQVDSNL